MKHSEKRNLFSSLIIVTLLFLAVGGCSHISRPFSPLLQPGEPASLHDDSYYHYTRAVLHSLNREFDSALGEYEQALKYNPDSSYLMVELATLYLQMNDSNSAISVLEASLIRNPDYIDSHLLLGTLYERTEEYEKAIHHYRTVIKLNPDLVDPYLLLSALYKVHADYERAVLILEELLTRDFDNHMAAYQLAHLYLETRRLDEAKYWLRRTITIEPSFESALKDLALLYEFEKNEEEALHLYREYLKLSSQDVAVRLRIGKLLLQRGQYEEAVKEFISILHHDSTFREVRFSLGVAYLFGKIDYEGAIDIFLDLLKENPGDDRVRYFLASSYQEQGNINQALNNFSTIAVSSDLFTASRIQIGLILNEIGRTEEAIRLIQDAIAVKDDESDLYTLLASLYENSGEIDRAAEVLSQALIALPENVNLRYRLGLVYEKTRQFEEAIQLMKSILERDPDNAEAMNFIGYSYADRNINLDEAETLIKEAIRLKPGSGHIIDSLGWLYFRQGKYSEAIQHLEEAFRLLPGDPTIAEHLGDAYAQSGMIEKALEVYGKGLERNPDNPALLEKINALQKNGK